MSNILRSAPSRTKRLPARKAWADISGLRIAGIIGAGACAMAGVIAWDAADRDRKLQTSTPAPIRRPMQDEDISPEAARAARDEEDSEELAAMQREQKREALLREIESAQKQIDEIEKQYGHMRSHAWSTDPNVPGKFLEQDALRQERDTRLEELRSLDQSPTD